MRSTQQIARRYLDAWTSGDRDTVTTLLAPDFTFAAGDLKIDGRGAFLDAGAFPRDASTTMVAEAYQDDVAFHRIASSNLVTDMAAFAASAGAGTGTEGRQGGGRG